MVGAVLQSQPARFRNNSTFIEQTTLHVDCALKCFVRDAKKKLKQKGKR